MSSGFTPPLATGVDAYRRRITVRTIDEFTTRCELQDDYHHFIVMLSHDGRSVLDVVVESRRWPWATCPDAALQLRALVGMQLSDRFTAAARHTDPSMNCTHQFDAASHAITHAAATTRDQRGPLRRYDVEITALLATASDGPRSNRLWVDGQLQLDWLVQSGRGAVGLPTPFDAAPWKGGFMRWADETLPADLAEQAIVLRRACDIGMGRGMDLDAIPHAHELLNIMSGVCYTMQPTIALGSTRNRGTIRDFADNPDGLHETS